MDDSRLRHLRLDGTVDRRKALTERGIDGRFRYLIRKRLVSSPFFLRLLSFADQHVSALKLTRGSIADQQRSVHNLVEDCPDAHLPGSSYGYDDELTEISVAVGYQQEIEDGLDQSRSESAKLYDHAVSTVSGILSEHASLNSFLNSCEIALGCSGEGQPRA